MDHTSIALLGAYLIALKVIGIRAHRRRSNSEDDFFLMGRSLRAPMLAATILATIINTLAFTAVPGLVYRGGILFLQMWLVVLVAPLLLYCLGPRLARYAREHELLSQGELFAHYYRANHLRYFTALIAVLSVAPFLVVQLSAVTKVFISASGNYLSYEQALLGTTAIIGFYVFFGGSRAVVWTDLLQAICFTALLTASAALCTSWAGGPVHAIQTLQSERPELWQFNAETRSQFLNNALSWPFAFFLWPQLFQRVFMAGSSLSIRRSARATWVLFGLCMLCIMTIGVMATVVLGPSVKDPDLLLSQLFVERWQLGNTLLIMALLASGMSTVDSGLLAVAAVFRRDVFPSSRRIHSTAVARLSIVVCLLLLFAAAASDAGRGAMLPLVNLGASIATLLLWPVLGMTVYPKLSSRAVSLAYITGGAAILAASTGALSYGAGASGLLAGFFGCCLGELGSRMLRGKVGYPISATNVKYVTCTRSGAER